jgi:UDP-N-acetylmuramate--alanine ligase
MMELNDIKRVYFLGIGGIGMSAIARYFLGRQVVVSGYDKTPSSIIEALEKEGAKVHFEEDVDLIDQEADLFIYTPAIPHTHAEWQWLKDRNKHLMKRSEVLQMILKDKYCICVAGTHGKTTISAMIGHLLRHSGYGCSAFLGGISINYQTNYWSAENNVVVVEADEYDRSFHRLTPRLAVVSSMDADHLDVYGTVEKMEEAYIQFADNILEYGLLVKHRKLTKLQPFLVSEIAYQLEGEDPGDPLPDESDYRNSDGDRIYPDAFAYNIRTDHGGYVFNIYLCGQRIKDVRLNTGGLHNIENMLAAMAVCYYLKIDMAKLVSGIASYRGVKRRFEYVLNERNENGKTAILIDDYAHHPQELKALIESVRQLFPELPLRIVFQPHLFSRTRDLAAEFASALALADEIVLLPLYPARELPIPGVSSKTIADKMPAEKVMCMEKDEWLNDLKKKKPSLQVMAGAGDIDRMVNEAKNIMMTN